LLAALVLATPGLASAAPERAVAAAVTAGSSTVAPVKAGVADASSYAQREHHDKQVAGYEGGSVVVVGISGGALIVLLLILLLI
jgi:hypothetical protein